MSKEQFEQVSKKLYEKMAADGLKGIMQYKPFSDDYWTESPKIVICNYENFGYQDIEKPSLLTYGDFKWWFDERMNKSKKRGKSKTVHYTAVFANALQRILHEFPSNGFTLREMKNSYKKYEELYQSMKNIMYMNLRPTSAKGNKQETGETHKIIRKYKDEIKAYIEALDADIFILSTKDAVGLFNFIFGIKDNQIVFKKEKRINNMMVFSVKHFGRPDYKYWYNKVLKIGYIWYHR
jgi:hypothetical protein